MRTLEEIAAKLLSFKSTLIFCHTRPDGDTLGSAAALCSGLESKGITCDIVCDGLVPAKYDYEPFFKRVLQPSQVKKSYECHVAVDVAGVNLLGYARNLFEANKNTLCIDHHVSNERYARDYYVRECAATCVLIAKLLEIMSVKFDKLIAETVLLGIVTDTGNFSHSNADREALITAGEMVGFGADLHKINYYMFKNQSKARAKLFSDVMGKMRFYENDKIAAIIIDKKSLEEAGAGSEVTEGFVDFPLSIEGVEVALSVLETKPNLYKISLRSKGKANVNAIASDFGGGGHILASGCVIAGPLEEVMEKLVRAVKVNCGFLN